MDEIEISRIVVGVDDSQHSRRALRWAAYLGQRTGSVIEAVHVWQRPIRTALTPGLAYLDWNPTVTAEKLVGQVVDDVFGSDRPLGLQTVALEGYPARALVDHSVGALLLIVGSRGSGGLGAFRGSVSAGAAKHARCAVLVVHDNEPPSEEPS